MREVTKSEEQQMQDELLCEITEHDIHTPIINPVKGKEDESGSNDVV